MKTRHALRGDSEGGDNDPDGEGVEGIEKCGGKASRVDREARRREVWRLMTVWFVVDLWEKQRRVDRREGKKGVATRRSERIQCTM